MYQMGDKGVIETLDSSTSNIYTGRTPPARAMGISLEATPSLMQILRSHKLATSHQDQTYPQTINQTLLPTQT